MPMYCLLPQVQHAGGSLDSKGIIPWQHVGNGTDAADPHPEVNTDVEQQQAQHAHAVNGSCGFQSDCRICQHQDMHGP